MLNSKEFVRELQLRHESTWMNPNVGSAETALAALPLTRTDVDDAEARLERFAPFIKKVFPETAADRGLIESPLTEIEHMRAWLNENEGAQLAGKLFLKRDSDLPVAGSVKARGGCYAVLKHTEDLALANRLVEMRDDYSVFATRAFRSFFSQYELHFGSTGNLGLSIGIMGAALGYRVTVHMSADARQWKKDLLRAKGVTVLEYGADYSYAVQKGRERAAEDPRSYFIDDENSVDLFLGYAVAARRLKAQLAEQNIAVDEEHPLLVYIPCGVGGAPGGICFGLKQEFGDAAHVYFAEPVEAPCMLLGLASGLQNEICVQDIGLTGRTAADGLAVDIDVGGGDIRMIEDRFGRHDIALRRCVMGACHAAAEQLGREVWKQGTGLAGMGFVPGRDRAIMPLVEAQHCRSQRGLHDMSGVVLALEASCRHEEAVEEQPVAFGRLHMRQ